MSYADYEEIQVTQLPDLVHCLTKEGWKLLEIVSVGEVAHSHQDIVREAGNCNNCSNYHSGGGGSISGSVVVSKPVYVMGLSKDKTVTDLRDDLKSNKQVVEAQEKELKRLEGDLRDQVRALGDSRHTVKTLEERAERNCEDLRKKDLLEGHLQKAKKLVGDRDWKREVLGEKDEDAAR